jgi:hypothetical protein
MNKISVLWNNRNNLQTNKNLSSRYQIVVLNNHSSSSCSNWGEITHGVPQGSILCPPPFLLYINDLPQMTVLKLSYLQMILVWLSVTLILQISKKSVNKIIQDINEWFHTNVFSLNLDKTHFIQFVTKNSSSIDLNIMRGNKKITNAYNTKFLGLTLDNTLSRRTHIDTIIPKLSSAIFALRVVKPFLSQDSLKMVY